MSHEDAVVTGRIEMVWDRSYSTATLLNAATPLGKGWTNRYFCRLQALGNQYQFVGPEGYEQIFQDETGQLPEGGLIRSLDTCEEITYRDHQIVLTRWHMGGGDIQRWVFSRLANGQFRLSGVEDVIGRAVDLYYDSHGSLMQITQRRERRSLLLRYSDSRIVEVELACANGRRRTVAAYEYDDRGFLKRASDALGFADEFAYDDDGKLVREVSRNGGVFHFSYDGLGRCTSTWGAGGYDQKYLRFSDQIGWTEVRNGHGDKWQFQWNGSGQILTEISPLGALTKTQYDEHGRVLERTDPNGGVWGYSYDANGNRAAITNPAGKIREFEFSARHQGTAYRDEMGNGWTGEYDSRGFLIETKDPAGREWLYEYDDQGDLRTMRGPENYVVDFTYDAFGNCLSIADFRGGITLLKSDEEGRLTSRTSPSAGSTKYSWDAAGQLVGVEYADASRVRFAYHASGKVSELADETGRVTRLRYGACGILQERIDPAGNSIRYEWGAEPDELLAIENQKGERCTFEYDADRRIVREVMFDGRTREFLYDAGGNCMEFQSAHGRTLLTRDALGRLIRRLRPEGDEEFYAYDDRGYLIEARNALSTVALEYDAVGRIVTEARDGQVVQHTYGVWGRTKRVSPLGGITEFEWDKDYVRRIRLQNGASIEWDIDPVGRIRSRKFSSGASEIYSHDLRGHLIGQKLVGASGTVLRASEYAYDLAGHPVEVSLHGKDLQVDYDPLHQIRSARGPSGVLEALDFDVAGNITKWSRDGVHHESTYGVGNRLLKSSDSRGEEIAFRYDAEGNLVEKTTSRPAGVETFTFAYDSSNRLVSAAAPDGKPTRYQYDALGRRISKQTETSKVDYLWESYELVAEVHSTPEKRSSNVEYVSSGFTPLAASQSGQAYFYHYDQIGAPVEVRDENGKSVWSGNRSSYDVRAADMPAAFSNPWRLPGQYNDSETGLHYNGFRYYDPDIGRYITQDPIGLEGGPNVYGYVANPLAYADPLGLQPPGPTPGGNTLPPYDGGKTQGVLVRPNGQETPLASGYDGPSKSMGYLPGANGNIKSHVEAHAAATMRQEGLDEATLYINRVPCPTKDPRSKGCDDALKQMLPEGAKLRVIGPDGFEKTYTGEPDRPQSKRRKKQRNC